jgi:hypothetical protein
MFLRAHACNATCMSEGGCNSQIREEMLEELLAFCNHVIHYFNTILIPDDRNSTDFVRQLPQAYNFQQRESELPTAFMTGCSIA